MKAVLRLPQAAPGLRPLTLTASPAMVPLLGAPLIEPLLTQLARTGVTEITLLHERFSTEVSEYFRDGRRLGALLSHVSVDPGADLTTQLEEALRDHDGSEPILYIEAPGWTSASAAALLDAHASTGASISFVGAAGLRLAVVDPASAAPFAWDAAVEIGGAFGWRPVVNLRQWWDLSLAALRSEAPGVTPPMPEPAPGVHTANPRSSWEQARISGPVWVGPGSRLELGAVIEGPAWIGSGCRIGPEVLLTRCVVENHTSLPEPVELVDRYVVRNRAFAADGSTLILGDALVTPPVEQDAASADLVRLATRVSGLRSPVFR